MQALLRQISTYIAGLSFVGLIGAGLFFALSLFPSLIPRAAVIQGLLSGFSAAIGFWVGLGIIWIWAFLELPAFRRRLAKFVKLIASTATVILFGYSLWRTVTWQDSLREFLALDPLDSTYTLVVLLIALPVAVLLREFGRAFAGIAMVISRVLDRLIPRRISTFLGVTLAAVLLVNLVSGTIGRVTLQMLDSMFLALDQLIDDDLQPPSEAFATGSPQSLVSWEQLGRQGRHFVVTGPTREDIESFQSAKAMRPIRVYVGLGAADDVHERADLALAEMKRVGAFDRSVLVIATPTGTGWIDEAAIDSLEYLHRGDTAVVAQQYSYLTSYISLFVEPGFSKESATALFNVVYDHWKRLPKETRPRLYLHGLSLGSYGSEQSMDLYFVLGDLIHGAVWSGPPFRSPDWASFTRNRNPGSPVWLPKFGNGSLVRFTNQDNALNIPDASWGPVRLVYLQYASDPITFFSPDLFLHEPGWLSGERGPDVSPELNWFPIVTALQVAFDMIGASALGPGLGHLYAASDYIDAWIAVTEPEGWTDTDVVRLKARLAE